MRLVRFLVAGCLIAGATGLARAEPPKGAMQLAQIFNRPPRDVPPDPDGFPAQQTQDNGGLLVRIDRLENQLRTLTGQIEQMQFQHRKLEEAMRKMQQDNELRFREAGKAPAGGKRPDAPPPVAAVPDAPVAQAPVRPRRPGGDAFDPAADPAAPGAPRPIGTLPAGPLAGGDVDPDAPVDILKGNPPPAGPSGQPPAGAAALPSQPPKPRDDYDNAIALYRQGQYEPAEAGLRVYLQKNPAGRLVPDAVFFLGETYFQRQRHREAAEQYLKLSTDYSKSGKAPDALVRLGMSLNAMGAREQACATFGEVARKYPASAAAIRGADRESKRAHC